MVGGRVPASHVRVASLLLSDAALARPHSWRLVAAGYERGVRPRTRPGEGPRAAAAAAGGRRPRPRRDLAASAAAAVPRSLVAADALRRQGPGRGEGAVPAMGAVGCPAAGGTGRGELAGARPAGAALDRARRGGRAVAGRLLSAGAFLVGSSCEAEAFHSTAVAALGPSDKELECRREYLGDQADARGLEEALRRGSPIRSGSSDDADEGPIAVAEGGESLEEAAAGPEATEEIPAVPIATAEYSSGLAGGEPEQEGDSGAGPEEEEEAGEAIPLSLTPTLPSLQALEAASERDGTIQGEETGDVAGSVRSFSAGSPAVSSCGQGAASSRGPAARSGSDHSSLTSSMDSRASAEALLASVGFRDLPLMNTFAMA